MQVSPQGQRQERSWQVPDTVLELTPSAGPHVPHPETQSSSLLLLGSGSLSAWSAVSGLLIPLHTLHLHPLN